MSPATPDATLASRDLREGGRWTWAQSLKNALIYASARALLAGLGPLPRPWLLALGRGLGAVAHALLRHARLTAARNVRRGLPDLSEAERDALVRSTFRALGAHLGDTVDLYGKGSLSAVLPLEEGSDAVLAEARRDGRGVVFASAHLGPWERVAASLVRADVPLVTLARAAYDPRLTRVLVALRERHGVRAIFRGTAGAAARIVRTLRSGGVLGAPMDLASRVPTVEVPFLGVPAPTPVGPARLALRTGARVVVGTYTPGDCIRIRAIRTDDLTSGEAGERELLRRVNDELSARIRGAPTHWPWMHERFPAPR
ncbi:MAG: hypothetical protein IPF92_00905 [Myxococcales bacterium]|nr:hypothetical protein [Myxococcales bacterium]